MTRTANGDEEDLHHHLHHISITSPSKGDQVTIKRAGSEDTHVVTESCDRNNTDITLNNTDIMPSKRTDQGIYNDKIKNR